MHHHEMQLHPGKRRKLLSVMRRQCVCPSQPAWKGGQDSGSLAAPLTFSWLWPAVSHQSKLKSEAEKCLQRINLHLLKLKNSHGLISSFQEGNQNSNTLITLISWRNYISRVIWKNTCDSICPEKIKNVSTDKIQVILNLCKSFICVEHR